MKITFRNTIATFAAVAFLAGASVLALARDHASENKKCSIAVFAKVAPKVSNVCDEQTVRKLAKNGQVFEQNQMGMASVLGIMPGSNAKDALAWFERAAHKGYAPAQVNLAVMYSNGWGTQPNQAVALHWLHEAANQGYVGANYNLGVMYLEGKGVPQDYAEALRYFRKGAEGGDTRAQNNLGYLYDKGLGVKQDFVAAASWYKQAAEAGDAMGQNNFADLLLRGQGVPQNNSEAFHWFEQSALQGHTGARIKLGYLYANGVGTARDLQAAYEWVLAASLAGDQRGQYLLKPLEDQLSTDQLRRAKDRAQVLFADKGTGEMSARLDPGYLDEHERGKSADLPTQQLLP